jgi:hypothetical protein
MILEEKAFEGLLAEVSSECRALGGVSYCSPRALTLASGLEVVLMFSDPLVWTLPDFGDNDLAGVDYWLEREHESEWASQTHLWRPRLGSP